MSARKWYNQENPWENYWHCPSKQCQGEEPKIWEFEFCQQNCLYYEVGLSGPFRVLSASDSLFLKPGLGQSRPKTYQCSSPSPPLSLHANIPIKEENEKARWFHLSGLFHTSSYELILMIHINLSKPKHYLIISLKVVGREPTCWLSNSDSAFMRQTELFFCSTLYISGDFTNLEKTNSQVN